MKKNWVILVALLGMAENAWPANNHPLTPRTSRTSSQFDKEFQKRTQAQYQATQELNKKIEAQLSRQAAHVIEDGVKKIEEVVEEVEEAVEEEYEEAVATKNRIWTWVQAHPWITVLTVLPTALLINEIYIQWRNRNSKNPIIVPVDEDDDHIDVTPDQDLLLEEAFNQIDQQIADPGLIDLSNQGTVSNQNFTDNVTWLEQAFPRIMNSAPRRLILIACLYAALYGGYRSTNRVQNALPKKRRLSSVSHLP